MVVNNLHCEICDKDYVGKTRNHFKKRTSQHSHDVWKVIESGRKNFGPIGKELAGTGTPKQMHSPSISWTTAENVSTAMKSKTRSKQ